MQNDQTLCIYCMFSPLLGSDECHGSSHIGNTALHVAVLRCRLGLLVQLVCMGFVQRQPSVSDMTPSIFRNCSLDASDARQISRDFSRSTTSLTRSKRSVRRVSPTPHTNLSLIRDSPKVPCSRKNAEVCHILVY